MDKEKLRLQLLKIFCGEFERFIATLKEDVLVLHQEGDGARRAEAIERLHRDTHGVKGAARAAGVPGVQRACRSLEATLADVKAGRRAVDAALVCLLRSAQEAFSEVLERLGASQDGTGPLLEALLVQLETGAGSAADARTLAS